MRLTILCVIVTIVLFGCAQVDKPKPVYEVDIQNQILSQSFSKKGAELYCDQPTYLKCLKITRDQCLKELKPFNKECFDYASGQVNGKLSGNTEKFASLFGICMFSKHIMYRGDENIKEIGFCLQNNPFDKDQIEKSLTLTNYELTLPIPKNQLIKLRREDGR